jgi:prepilin-type N-terminal cleavage/methylation domain-containing protein
MKMNKGFSLVELIVVIAIMAVLAGVAVPVYSAYTENAKIGVDENYAADIWHAADIASALHGVEFNKIEISPNGTYTIMNDGAAVTNADFLEAVTDVVKKQSLKSNEYASGMTVSGTGEDAYTAETVANPTPETNA